jgi:hypothetical protein
MSLDIVTEVWDALRSHIDFSERKDAADTLVNLLIDNGYDADDIKESFRGDKDIGGALKFYREQHEAEEYEDYDEEGDDDEDW